MENENTLDYTLVPLGLLLLLLYHLYLFHRIATNPTSTVIGVNAINRRLWAHTVMSDQSKNGTMAVMTLGNDMSASTLLASVSITLCSITILLLNSAKLSTSFVLGDKSVASQTVKFTTLLVCFLTAFFCNIESIRYYSHACVLINVPLSSTGNGHVTEEYVVTMINRANYWWGAGLKSFYFAFPLFLWVFGPIPMFVCSVVIVTVLFFIDQTPDISAPKEETKVKPGYAQIPGQPTV